MMKNISLYKEHHVSHARYGNSFKIHFGYIAALLNFLESESAIDYGCGKNRLAEKLLEYGIRNVERYDPAIPGIDRLPTGRYDCLINTDVLEHIPEDELPEILQQFKSLSDTAIIIPHLEKASAILPNGENAHCTLKSPDEWGSFLLNYYRNVIQLPHHSSSHAMFICSDRDLKAERMRNIAQLISFMRITYSVKNFGLTERWSKRMRMALKLLRGKKAFEKLRY